MPSALLGLQGSNKIVWSEAPFWKDRYCPSHASDGTKRCTGCTRLQPVGELLELQMHYLV